MTVKTHSPGPWEVVALNGFGPFAIRMPTPPGTKQQTHYGIGQIGTPENASAVAAVPEMLEALTLCQAALASMIAPDAIKNSTVLSAFAQATEAEAKARAAIAKATGS